MRYRGWEAVGIMALTCLALGLTEPRIKNVDLIGPTWVQPALFVVAALACLTVLVWPDAPITRIGSGALVSFAFAWRATFALITDLFLDGGRPLFAVFLYVGFSLYISLTWHRVLPPPGSVRARLREIAGEP